MEVIKMKNVSKKFKKNVLYKDINFALNKGDAVGIVGANGSGKSVLFKMITGLETPDSGSIEVNGDMLGEERDFPKKVGILVDQPGYIDYYSGFKNLQLLAEIQNTIGSDEIKYYMRRVGLDPEDKTKVKNYSMGMKQKLGIAQAIMEKQEIVLLDEPFNALDFKTNADILKLLLELKEEGKTLMLTSHQHEYLEKVCSKIYIIVDGELQHLSDELKEEYFII